MLGQERSIVKTDSDYQTVLSNLEQIMTYTWDNRLSIREELNQKRITVKEKALSSFIKIKELLYAIEQ